MKKGTFPVFFFFSCLTLAAQDPEISLQWDGSSRASYEGVLLIPVAGAGYQSSKVQATKEPGGLIAQKWTIAGPNPGRYKFFVRNKTLDNEFGDWAGFEWNDYVVVKVKSGDVVRSFKPPTGAGALWYAFEILGESGEIVPIGQIVPRRGALFGMITDAATALPIRGASAALQKDGKSISNDTTANSGLYLFFTKPESYEIRFSKSGYIAIKDQIDLTGYEYPTRLDTNLCPILREDEYRFVLSWNYFPADLDLELHGKDEEGRDFSYSSKSKKGVPGSFFLEMSGDRGFDAESISLQKLPPGVISVRVVAPQTKGDSFQLGYSKARVRVYRADKLLRTFHVDPGQPGNQWDVFELDGRSEEISPIERLRTGP